MHTNTAQVCRCRPLPCLIFTTEVCCLGTAILMSEHMLQAAIKHDIANNQQAGPQLHARSKLCEQVGASSWPHHLHIEHSPWALSLRYHMQRPAWTHLLCGRLGPVHILLPASIQKAATPSTTRLHMRHIVIFQKAKQVKGCRPGRSCPRPVPLCNNAASKLHT